jgi:hypothetical protein
MIKVTCRWVSMPHLMSRYGTQLSFKFSFLLCQNVRLPRSSKYQVLLDMQFLLERNLHVLVRLRSVSGKHQPGRSMRSLPAHPLPSTLKLSHPLGSLSNKAPGALSNSSRITSMHQGSSDCVLPPSRATLQRPVPRASPRRSTKRRRQC